MAKFIFNEKITRETLLKAKKLGFSDKQLAYIY
jgi:hypothetical protein